MIKERFLLYTILFITVLSISSCSLIKIQTDQKPLGVRALNTRILTQNFAKEALDRVELAADSIYNLALNEKNIQLNTLRWKIQTSQELGKISFQTEPKIALMDTWAYFLEVKNSIENPKLVKLFGAYKNVALDAVNENIDGIQKVASSVLAKDEYNLIKSFVVDYSNNFSLLSQEEFKHKSIRESYLEFKNIPDSLAVQTVGTLSEVVADATNRFGYYSDASGKRMNWKTEMLLREKGLDSLDLEAKLAEIDKQFNRLLEVAESSPETLDEAIKEFRDNISPLFSSLNYEIGSAMQSFSSDVESIDEFLNRERIALDSIIKRERMTLTSKADYLVEMGIERAFDSVENTLKNLIIYFTLLFIVVLGLPFYLGYIIGNRKSKS